MPTRGDARHRGATWDTFALATAAAVVVVLAVRLSATRTDPYATALWLSAAALGFAAWSIRRRGRELGTQRRRADTAEVERVRLQHRLADVEARLRSLQGLLAMCSWCKSIRDGVGEWRSLEDHLEMHLQASITHAVCPECMRAQYPGLFEGESSPA